MFAFLSRRSSFCCSPVLASAAKFFHAKLQPQYQPIAYFF